MFRKKSQADMVQTTVAIMQMLVEAQTVIGLRLLGMVGMWPVAERENLRMVTEKTKAAQESGRAMARAAFAGGGPGTIALAGVRPVRRRTRSNVKRLTGVTSRNRD